MRAFLRPHGLHLVQHAEPLHAPSASCRTPEPLRPIQPNIVRLGPISVSPSVYPASRHDSDQSGGCTWQSDKRRSSKAPALTMIVTRAVNAHRPNTVRAWTLGEKLFPKYLHFVPHYAIIYTCKTKRIASGK